MSELPIVIQRLFQSYDPLVVLEIMSQEIGRFTVQKFSDADFNGKEGIELENELKYYRLKIEQAAEQMKKAICPNPPVNIPVHRWNLRVHSRELFQRYHKDDLEGHWGTLISPDLDQHHSIGRSQLERSLTGVTVDDLITYSMREIIMPQEERWMKIHLSKKRKAVFKEVVSRLNEQRTMVERGSIPYAYIQRDWIKKDEHFEVTQLVRMGVLKKEYGFNGTWQIIWDESFCRQYARESVANTLIALAASIS